MMMRSQQAKARLASARIIGLPVEERPAVNDIYVERGRYLSSPHGEVLVEKRFAEEANTAFAEFRERYRPGKDHD